MSASAVTDQIDRETAVDLMRTMVTIRDFETRAGELFAAGQLPGFIHLSIGQEAVAAGVCAALDDDDYLTTTHRGHGHCIAKGGGVVAMMAELYGRTGGYALGRSGSMHIADSSVGILGANAIVGGGVPMALGGAFAAQLDGRQRVSVAFMGDGAVAEGVVHECLNLASLWNLPMIFVVEMNGYAELTPVTTHLANPDLLALATAFGVGAERVDGDDVAAVVAAARRAVEHGRAGEGPTLLEVTTARVRGHFEGDPQRYRSREDLDALRARDPLPAWREVLQTSYGLSDAEVDDIARSARAEIDDAVEQAEAMAPAEAADLTRFVYPEEEQ